MPIVHVRINDSATGQPTPVRLRFSQPEGNYFPPLGRLAIFATGRNQDVGGNLLLGSKAYAYIDGVCETPLAAGPLHVEITKGPEYLPHVVDTTLALGKLALRFTIDRWIDMRREGWYSGDIRSHFLTPHAALLEAAAEDVAVVNLLATESRIADSEGHSYWSIPQLLAFSGQRPILEGPGCMVVVNTLNTHPVLGSLGLLNCHRVVYPLRFGDSGAWDKWSLQDWCDQCHRKGGLVVWAQMHQEQGLIGGEALADLILGKVDALEIDSRAGAPFTILPDWYHLLNCGFTIPLAGSSGKDSNAIALGSMRTYARLQPGAAWNYQSWIEAVRAGRTFITNAPLLSFTVNGQDPGTVLGATALTQPLSVRAEAMSLAPFEYLELLHNGEVIASASAVGSPAQARLELELPPASNGWFAARCRGEASPFPGPASQKVFAHSSPIYVRVPGQAPPTHPAAAEVLLQNLDQLFDWIQLQSHVPNDRQRAHLVEIFQSARIELLRRAGRQSN